MRAFQQARMHNTYVETRVPISRTMPTATETYLLQAPLEDASTESSHIHTTHTQHYYIGHGVFYMKSISAGRLARKNHLHSFQLASGKLTYFMIRIPRRFSNFPRSSRRLLLWYSDKQRLCSALKTRYGLRFVPTPFFPPHRWDKLKCRWKWQSRKSCTVSSRNIAIYFHLISQYGQNTMGRGICRRWVIYFRLSGKLIKILFVPLISLARFTNTREK